MILVDASVYAEGTGEMARLPRLLAYAGVSARLLILTKKKIRVFFGLKLAKFHWTMSMIQNC